MSRLPLSITSPTMTVTAAVPTSRPTRYRSLRAMRIRSVAVLGCGGRCRSGTPRTAHEDAFVESQIDVVDVAKAVAQASAAGRCSAAGARRSGVAEMQPRRVVIEHHRGVARRSSRPSATRAGGDPARSSSAARQRPSAGTRSGRRRGPAGRATTRARPRPADRGLIPRAVVVDDRATLVHEDRADRRAAQSAIGARSVMSMVTVDGNTRDNARRPPTVSRGGGAGRPKSAWKMSRANAVDEVLHLARRQVDVPANAARRMPEQVAVERASCRARRR